MKIKKLYSLIMAAMMLFTLIPSYISAEDALTFTVIDATPGDNGHIGTNLTDGSKSTSWGMNWTNGTTKAYAIIKASRKFVADGYTITTGEDNKSYKNRNPRDWTLYGCNDYDETNKTGGSWAVLDKVTNDTVLQDSNSTSFSYDFSNSAAYLYYKLEITANRGNSFLKIGEFELINAAARPIKFTAVDGKPGNDSQKENYTNLFDGKKTSDNYTKYCVDKGDVYVVAKADTPVAVTGYTFTTGNDNSGYKNRNPKSWTLSGCNDYNESTKTGTWDIIDSVTDDTTMKDENYTPFSFTFNNEKFYKYYRFDFKEDQGAGLMQLCEIEFKYATCIHEWTETDRKNCTCTTAGYIKLECSKCSGVQTLEISPLGHDWRTDSEVPPTCTEIGHSYQTCTKCAAKQTVELPIIDHDWQTLSETEVSPTCFDSGFISKQCTVCGLNKESVLPPLGHKQGTDGKCENCREYIIKVGDKYYCDLQKAIGEALYNVPVILLQNIAIDSTLTITNQRILDLNGCTIKQINNCRAIKVSDNFTLRDSSENHTGTITGGSASGIGIDAIGGGVYVSEYETFNMEGGTISDCTANAGGGGIYVENNAKLNMSGGAVIKNCTTVKLHGGGIMNYGTAVINDSKIINCSSDSGGGGIYADGKKAGGILHLYNTVIEGCSVAMNGGGGITASATTVTVNENTAIRNNTAPNNYGAGILATDKAIVEVNNSQIMQNTANEAAGILANLNSSVTLNGSEVTGNEANSNGGGIMLSSASLTIANSSISNNESNSNGGGIYVSYNSNVKFNSGSIDANRAGSNGGGVYITSDSSMDLTGGMITQNNAESLGGGIYAGGAISVGKTPQVSGNCLVSEGETGAEEISNNIYLPNGKTITIADEGLSGSLTETGYIFPALYVTAKNGSAVITGTCTEDSCEYFYSDNADYAAAYEDGVIKLLSGYKVTFVYDAKIGDIRTTTVAGGHKVKKPEGEPWKRGYAFIGWLLDGKDYDFSTPVTKDITLTPKWSKPAVSITSDGFEATAVGYSTTLYLAAYDKSGVLLDACIIPLSEGSYSKSFAEVGLDTSNAAKITAFLWDYNAAPLCGKASL